MKINYKVNYLGAFLSTKCGIIMESQKDLDTILEYFHSRGIYWITGKDGQQKIVLNANGRNYVLACLDKKSKDNVKYCISEHQREIESSRLININENSGWPDDLKNLPKIKSSHILKQLEL